MKMIEMLEKSNGAYLDDTALNYYGNRLTYGQFFELIHKYSQAFQSFGIKEGDHVSVCLPTIPEAICIWYGLNKIGAVYHSILPMASREQIVEILRGSNSKMFITLDSLYHRVGGALEEVRTPFKIKVSANSSLPFGIRAFKSLSDMMKKGAHKDIPDDYMSINKFLRNSINGKVKTSEWKSDSVSIVTNSSGSTLLSNKSPMLSDYGMNAMAANYKAALSDIRRGQSFHSCIPILYATGASNSINLPLQLGLPLLLEPVYNKDVYPDRFMKLKPNLSIVPPPHAKSLLDYLRTEYKNGNPDRNLLSFVDVFSVGGAPMPIPWEEELEFYLHHFGSTTAIGKGYGLSEHNSALTASTKRMIGAAGVVLPGVIMGIFDSATGDELDFGEEGEIRSISPSDMVGYFNDEEATRRYFRTDESGRRWGYTEDIGRLELIDGDVWLFYTGRKKDIVNIDGRDVFLSKSQAKIFECDLIDDCEIVMAEYNNSKISVAHIVLRDSTTRREDALIRLNQAFEGGELSEPYAYKFHNVLPVLISGKPDKHTLANDTTGCIRYENGLIVPVADTLHAVET